MKLIYAFAIILCTVTAFGQNRESMSWGDLSINQKIPLSIAKTDFDKKYGGKYEIAEPLPGETCQSTSAEVIEYRGARFELVNDTLQFRSIDFGKRRNMYMQFKDDWFDHTTTLKYFKRAYPDTASFIEEFEGENGELMEMITFFPEDENAPYEWRLYFRDGRLDSIECFLYCL